MFLQPILSQSFALFFLVSSGAIIFLSLLTLSKMNKIRNLQERIKRLEKSLEEMDEQAKMIVKTDSELSLIQEELDRKVTALLALQKLSQNLSSSLEEEKLFAGIKEGLIRDLGFDSCLIVVKKQNSLLVKFSLEIEEYFKETLIAEEGQKFFEFLSQRRIISHKDLPAEFIYLREKSGLKSFLVSSIQAKDFLGFLILGSRYEEDNPSGTREVVEIFSAQLAQSLENIHLFEELYATQRELEDRVKERTQSLQKALEEIEKISRLKSEFVSAVSHEFRTPLTSIKGYASLLVEEKFGKIPDEVKLRLERINQQADILVGMINDLLDIARIESGRTKIEFQKADLVELIQRVKEFFYPQLERKKLKLNLNLPPSLSIEVDKSLIERVFINLLSNAIKFTPEGKEIQISLRKEDGFVQVSVRDQGVGIPTHELENIFKEFYRVENPLQKEAKGTGLGLSLVKNIIKAHRGEIWVESKVGEGSNFIFKLPLTQSN